MERLTNKDTLKVAYDAWELCGLDSVCKRDCFKPTPCKIPQIVRKLAEYEDTEEKGTILRLPCKAGDTVYYLTTECDDCKDKHDCCQALCKKPKGYTKVSSAVIKQFRIYGNIHDHMTTTDNIASTTEKVFYFRDIGETVFLTEGEAKKCLGEQKW